MNRTIICLALGLLLWQCVPSKVWCSEFSLIQPRNQEQATDEARDRKFVLIVKLDEANIGQIRRTGLLKAKIPESMKNRVGAIRFQGPTSFLSEPIEIETNVDKRNQSLLVTLDNSILNRLDYQPIEIKVYDSGFDGLSLVYDANRSVAGTLQATPAVQGINDSQILFVRINSKRGIYGALKDLKTLSIKTGFGDIQVPTTQIAGIRVDKTKNQSVQVILHNGDLLSGFIEADKIIVKSRWGEKEIALNSIESITLKRESRIVADSNAPGGWRLQTASEKTQRTPITDAPRQSKQK